uniref:Helicase ATP-binding domain-containing protein n=1 Tax=viral metagenome TaxID=1070528 RepID=A0A6C0F3N8_9ZZZZ
MSSQQNTEDIESIENKIQSPDEIPGTSVTSPVEQAVLDRPDLEELKQRPPLQFEDASSSAATRSEEEEESAKASEAVEESASKLEAKTPASQPLEEEKATLFDDQSPTFTVKENAVVEDLEREFEENKCGDPENYYAGKCKKLLLKKETLEREYLAQHPNEDDYLYPSLNDPLFNVKISQKKEFSDTKYDGQLYDIKERSDELSRAEFELSPHQAFVKNFMSFQTPYNSLLLFHGLGSGKTCSAIGVSEEMRDYLKQMGISKRIIIVASPNVQDNFRLQLFDERKLKQVDGLWNIRACTGNKLIKEINPTNIKGLTREKVISQVKNLINASYLFLGYIEFANYIAKIERVKGDVKNEKQRQAQMRRNLNNEFNNRLVVIDEIHNIRISEDNENKKVAQNLTRLVMATDNLRLLLLSATPMYNSYREIVWLLNLMNINDRRAVVNVSDIFDKYGNFKQDKEGNDIGREMLVRKSTGYISFVRGENPYTFPFRVYPNLFAPEHTFQNIEEQYPRFQMNGKAIDGEDKLKILSLYLTTVGSYQALGYKYIIDSLRKKQFNITTSKGKIRDMPSFDEMESFGYTILTEPIEALNIIYPVDNLEQVVERSVAPISSQPKLIEAAESASDEPVSLTAVVLPGAAEKLAESDSKSTEEAEVPKASVVVEEVPEEQEEEEEIEVQGPTKQSVSTESFSYSGGATARTVGTTARTVGTTARTVGTTARTVGASARTVGASATQKKTFGKTLPAKTEIFEEDEDVAASEEEDEDEGTDREIFIDPSTLTGKRGLERMMRFINTTVPPVKGQFEYKTDNHMFATSEIGKYSSKIKSICDSIYSQEKDTVADGIILIYSQYIDGGLIPMALALEEMGFTRYGEKSKSLFKAPPVPPANVKTMKPQDKTVAGKFMPAKYVIISGDKRISPNNDADIKALTSDNNVDGHRIKVVLISKAGSEGLDLKFIRQVHIMDPWYNMNRIEQIIGRAVRNFSHSHKDLPFEKRNVEIFLYATLLENNEEEAADLYIYRVAEVKALQIGRVSRVLKETAVDCIINHEQANFTQENFREFLKAPVKQILSSGEVIEEFPVGDAPYSASCDYMKTCDYECNTSNELVADFKPSEDGGNLDTYNETFIIVNSDKIIQKIKQLMKERYFYKKKDLFARIKTPKDIPDIQIYAALTYLIDDNNEYITDKYGRTGYLKNIGEYYLFQPSELNYENISILDRSMPIDFKRSMIHFDVRKDLVNYVIQEKPKVEAPIKAVKKETAALKQQKREKEEEEEEEEAGLKEAEMIPLAKEPVKRMAEGPHEARQLAKHGLAIEGAKRILKEMEENYDLANHFARKEPKVPRGDDNWYKHCGIVMRKMVQSGVPAKDIMHFLIEHLVDFLTYKEKVDVLQYLYAKEVIDETSFEFKIKGCFDEKIILNKGVTGIILFNGDVRSVLILNRGKWTAAESEDINDLAPAIKKKYFDDPRHFNTNVGFIGSDKTGVFVFKVKDILNTRNTGARCDEAGKAKTIKLLNTIIGHEEYTKENTKGMVQQELCALQEFTLRLYNLQKKDNLVWFLDPEMAKISKF